MRWPLWLLGCLGLMLACSSRPAGPAELRLDISGMHCDSCAEALTDALRSVDGVMQAEVSLDTASARVVVPADRVDELAPRLVEAVTGLGYGAELGTSPAAAHPAHEGGT